ncbi:MAG TPA: MotA/TolQ/ExbB proton channel family protein, partial [Opitutales bacterium]|nr:MotA/TolQ/ExbB proton channel family protein [Opitutales bacterium]
ELDDLQTKVIALRAEAQAKRGQADSSDASIITLRNSVDSLNDSINYMTNLMSDYVVRYETLTSLAERPTITKITRPATEAKDNNDLSAGQRLTIELAVIDASINHIKEMLGGTIVQSDAISSSGSEEIQGTYVLIGPASYFVPADASIPAGVTSESANSIRPKVNVLKDPKIADQIRELASNKAATTVYGPPQALVVESENQTLWEEWVVGGMCMPFILGLAFAALIVAIYKWITLLGIRAAKPADLETILTKISQNDIEGARAYAAKIGGPVGDMLTAAVDNSSEDREVIEEILYEKIISAQPKLDRLLPFIAVVAATAPLLGLLGTVTGMIKTFKLITIVGTGDAGALSSGISEALITTKYGLISAIPAVIVHAMLLRKARGVIGSMEQTAVGFINGIMEVRESSDKSAQA